MSYFLITGDARKVFDAWMEKVNAAGEIHKAWVVEHLGADLPRVYRDTHFFAVCFDDERPGWKVAGKASNRVKSNNGMEPGTVWQRPTGRTKLARSFAALPYAPGRMTGLGAGWRLKFLTTPGFLWDPVRDLLIAELPEDELWPADGPSGAHRIPTSDYYLAVEDKPMSAETMALMAAHQHDFGAA